MALSGVLLPFRVQLARAGQYVLATNPTVGTGLAEVAAQTSYSATTPDMLIGNVDPTLNLALDYIKLEATAAMTAATSIEFAITVDFGPRTPTTDHTTVITPVNPLPSLPLAGTAPLIKVQSSTTASVLPALTGKGYTAARGGLGGLNIIGDEMYISFGESVSGIGFAGAADAAGQPGKRCSSCPPLILPPNWTAAVHIWAPSSSASFVPEFELGMYFC